MSFIILFEINMYIVGYVITDWQFKHYKVHNLKLLVTKQVNVDLKTRSEPFQRWPKASITVHCPDKCSVQGNLGT